MPITDAWLRSVNDKPQEKAMQVSDSNGLIARVGKTGKIAFEVRYSVNKKRSKVGIGSYPQVSLKEAREKTIDVKRLADSGLDPKVEKKMSRIQKSEQITVNELFYMWHEAYCSHHYSQPNEAKRQFERHISPKFGDLPFDRVDIHSWYSHFESLSRKYTTVTKMCLTLCKSMTMWGVRRKLIENAQVSQIRAKADLKIKNKMVERTLNDADIKNLYLYIDGSKMSPSNKIMLQLLLHFGCRGSELRLSKPEHFNLKKMTWTVPPENHKTGKLTGKPLIRPIISDIAPLVKLAKTLTTSEYMFPSSKNELMCRETLVAMPKLIKRWLTRREIETTNWTVHDLRRTMRTRISKLAPYNVAEIMIGHSLGQVQSIYDRYDYMEEQTAAYQAWWNCVQSILDPDSNNNVVNIKEAI